MSFTNSRILSHIVTIQRQVKSGHKLDYEDSSTNVNCLIMPFDDKSQSLGEEAQGQEYVIYFKWGTDIQTSDRVIDSANTVYTVDGVSNVNYGSRINWHYRVSANRQEVVNAL